MDKAAIFAFSSMSDEYPVFSSHVRLEDAVVRLMGAKGARAKITEHH